MAVVTSRTEFKSYCLRKLGSPVIQINVADEQVEDRIDDALEYYQDYHYDAVEDTYLAHQITQTDMDNKYIPINNNIIGIKQVIPLFQSENSSTNMFDHLQMVNEIITGRVPIRYNRHVNKLYLDIDWTAAVSVGENIIIEATRVIDPDTYTDVWNDRWLKRYATALIKKQWGENLTKYEGVQLPGGITFNGSRILDEANQEIEKLEQEMSLSYELPVDIMVG